MGTSAATGEFKKVYPQLPPPPVWIFSGTARLQSSQTT